MGYGPAAVGHPLILKMNWEARLKTLSSQLQLERKKRLEEEAVAHEKMLKQAIVADKKLALIAKQAAEMEVACLVLIMFFF